MNKGQNSEANAKTTPKKVKDSSNDIFFLWSLRPVSVIEYGKYVVVRSVVIICRIGEGNF